VWRTGPLVWNLCAVVHRRLLDWEDEHERGAPAARTPIAARTSDVEAWLDSDVDESLLTRWLSRLALFDWTFTHTNVRTLAPFDRRKISLRPALALYGLLHPLFDLRCKNRRKPAPDFGRKRQVISAESGT
jgi:CRISPR-associated protein Csx17